ncbi:MAG: hypothetical protein JSR80_06350 [Verrucomicrobia bacterium]|nr:hypothetical protein [Verrucomicrobiota bacterium]
MKKLYLVIATFLPLALFALDACGTFFGFADLLVWEAREENLDYVEPYLFGAQPPTAPSIFPSSIDTGARYSPGFRVGLGYARDWEILAYWTDFSSKAANDFSGQPFVVLLLSNDNNPVDANGTANARWKLKCDVVDVEFGYPLTWACFQFRPHLGVRGAWIDQKIDAFYTNVFFNGLTFPATDYASTTKNDFSGVGLRIGGDGSWNFWRGFSLFGKSGISLLYGQFEVRHREFLAAPVTSGGVTFPAGTERARMKLSPSQAAPAIDLTAGIGWDFCLCRFNVNVSVAWECQLWFTQNQMLQVLDDSGAISNNTLKGDLSLQGLTARLALGF